MIKFYPKYFLVVLIRFYRFFISPLFLASCRFYPTCSSFAIGAIEKYGVFSGGWLIVRRLFRCHPFSQDSGYDPLP